MCMYVSVCMCVSVHILVYAKESILAARMGLCRWGLVYPAAVGELGV